ncbi:ThiF family adenylyltransferase [Bacteroidota bacterium]
MMKDNEFPSWMERTVQLLGPEKMQRLQQSHVLVAGLGGVGSVAAESLARAGVGEFTIIDNDQIQASNINRQIPALHSTIGKSKTSVMEERLRDINPDIKIHAHQYYINEETLDELLSTNFDHIVDAIDTLTPKILFIERVRKRGMSLASSMGSAGKLDPTKIKIADFKKTYNCRLAYLLRKKLRKMEIIGGFRVVFSTELIDKSLILPAENEQNKKSILGTVSYIPSIFGNMLASIVIEDISSK